MSKLTRGQLTILEPSGKAHKFGSPQIYDKSDYPNPDKSATPSAADSLEVTLTVKKDAFWVRMLLQSDLGFAESYMDGEVECSDLAGMFQVSFCEGRVTAELEADPSLNLAQLFILNRKNLDELSTGLAGSLFSAFNAVLNTRFVNSLSNAISNVSWHSRLSDSESPSLNATHHSAQISAHYDISNRMFEAFLSPDMTYSCAIWSEAEGGLNGDLFPEKRKQLPSPGVDELEAAQVRKLRRLIERARLSKGDRVLEIGSGWGSLAIEVSGGNPYRSNSLLYADWRFDCSSGCALLRLHCRHAHPFHRAEGARRGPHRRRWPDRQHHRSPPRLPLRARVMERVFRPRHLLRDD